MATCVRQSRASQSFPSTLISNHNVISICIFMFAVAIGSVQNAAQARDKQRPILSTKSVLLHEKEYDPAAVKIASNSVEGSDKNDHSQIKPTAGKAESTNDKAKSVLPNAARDSLAVADSRGVFETASEAEHHSSMKIYFILLVIGLSALVVHLLNVLKCHFLPESIAVIFVGGLIGLALKLTTTDAAALTRWKQEAFFPPTAFFLIMLPPIIFESGYNLQKGAFFQNIGSIMVFAVFGTLISAIVVGGGVFLLGVIEVVYPLHAIECFEFGAIISAVDPVATIAIFKALNVHQTLHMLVFGESILNDAVAIVLASTIQELGHANSTSASSGASHSMSGFAAVAFAIRRFLTMFFASALLGVVFGLLSALALKHINFRQQPALEFAIMLIFSYMPYGLAEGINLSGIMAILACGVTMSHYTHGNLSPATQITMHQTLRSLAFMAETCVFAYLGLALLSFQPSDFRLSLICWSIVLILLARALNIYPLAHALNRYRTHHNKISKQMMFIMWFSGLRGAIAYALALHMEFAGDDRESSEHRQVIVTTVLAIVLFTTIIMGGATSPVLTYIQKHYHDKLEFDDEVSLKTDVEDVDDENVSVSIFNADESGLPPSSASNQMLSGDTGAFADDEIKFFSANHHSQNAVKVVPRRLIKPHRMHSHGRPRNSHVRGQIMLSKTYEPDVTDDMDEVGSVASAASIHDDDDGEGGLAMKSGKTFVAANRSSESVLLDSDRTNRSRHIKQRTGTEHAYNSNGFERFDAKYLRPIFLRHYSTRELVSGERMVRRLTAAGTWVKAQLEELGEELGDAYSRSRSRVSLHQHVSNASMTPEPISRTVRYSSSLSGGAGDGDHIFANNNALSKTAIMVEDDEMRQK